MAHTMFSHKRGKDEVLDKFYALRSWVLPIICIWELVDSYP